MSSLILQQVIPFQERATFIGDLTIHQTQAELPTLIPAKLRRKVRIQTQESGKHPRGKSVQAKSS